MFTEILNSFLNVRNKVKNADGEWVDMEQNEEKLLSISKQIDLDVDNQTNIVVEHWDGKYIIDSIQFSADEPVQPQLHTKPDPVAYTDQIFHANPSVGSRRNGAGALYIDQYGHDYFEITGKNTENGSYTRYTISLKKPIILPHGFRFQFGYLGSLLRDGVTPREAFPIGVKMVYRKIG